MPKNTSLAFSTSPPLAVSSHLLLPAVRWMQPTSTVIPHSQLYSCILNCTQTWVSHRNLKFNMCTAELQNSLYKPCLSHMAPHCLVPQPWILTSFLIPQPWHLQLQNFINSLSKPLVSIPPMPSPLLLPKFKLSSFLPQKIGTASYSKHLPSAATVLTFTSDHGSSLPQRHPMCQLSRMWCSPYVLHNFLPPWSSTWGSYT